jgi:hypothetical protein
LLDTPGWMAAGAKNRTIYAGLTRETGVTTYFAAQRGRTYRTTPYYGTARAADPRTTATLSRCAVLIALAGNGVQGLVGAAGGSGVSRSSARKARSRALRALGGALRLFGGVPAEQGLAVLSARTLAAPATLGCPRRSREGGQRSAHKGCSHQPQRLSPGDGPTPSPA